MHLAIIHATKDIIHAVMDLYPMLINEADNNNFLPLHYAMGISMPAIPQQKESVGTKVDHCLLQLLL